MVDAFTDFYDERPATHINGSKQIDLILVSCRLAPYIDRAFILSPGTLRKKSGIWHLAKKFAK
jgi:hypothetical protein